MSSENTTYRERYYALLAEMQNLEHEVRTPILQARAYAEKILLAHKGKDRSSQRDLYAIRGLCQKASSVVQTMRFVATNDASETTGFEPQRLDEGWLVRSLIEIAEDAETLTGPDRRLAFDVLRQDFYVLRRLNVVADQRLVLQAVWNLVDNAAKYSFPGTRVSIEGGISKSGRFVISVTNTGIPIARSEANQALKRGWRGEAARLVTASGAGLGLWIASQIMDLHNGAIVVSPASKSGANQVQLLFSTE